MIYLVAYSSYERVRYDVCMALPEVEADWSSLVSFFSGAGPQNPY